MKIKIRLLIILTMLFAIAFSSKSMDTKLQSKLNTQGNKQTQFIIGQDLSYVNMMEDCGAQYRENGELKDVYQIFADNGTDLVRVRLWHNPDWQVILSQPEGVKAQYSNFNDVKETIHRAKSVGMQVMLDIHFSDFWCDPGRQIVPKAWEAIANNEAILQDSVYNYVTQTLTALNNENLMPEYVKIGNENNSGIMTHTGMDSQYRGINQVSNSWERHAKLFNAGIKAVRDVSAETAIKPQIALHVADHSKVAWFYNNLIQNGVTDFDIMGFTYYYSYHGGSPADAGSVIRNVLNTHPGYEAMVVETGYLWDTENIDNLGNIITNPHPGYLPVSPANQLKFMVDLSNEVYNAGGSGVIFWEPAWVSTPCSTPWGTGSSHEHVAFFDHRDKLNYMKHGGGGWPNAFKSGDVPDEVNVTFRVDMTGQDVSQGVYIVGQMTNWDFVQMDNKGSNIYSTSFVLQPGEVYAYYFIRNNNWDNYQSYRETIPVECAYSAELLNDPDWDTDRAFIVPENDTVIAYMWASCETFVSNTEDFEWKNTFKIYPNPSLNKEIFIENNNFNFQKSRIELIDSKGNTTIPAFINIENHKVNIKLNHSRNGIYIIKITDGLTTYTNKIMFL